ncbi:hypothetical protein H072_1854 [Dactylellina haptotyla CBS 200.50]|uniref:ferroxidase n=1 Tax=Dactylellina haptotyla (strain CBS 200.50) TaxID=1284197 RepID=S8AMF9_DACHA|nr:hypothetical protein H072_1854 [Dactylellina haptotyla CBS 200.50]
MRHALVAASSRLRKTQPVAVLLSHDRSYYKSSPRTQYVSNPRLLHTTPSRLAGTESTPLSEDRYHEIADETLDSILVELEELVENTKGFDVEFSAGVLTLDTPEGTYVINKQPPNKQIWLSSPINGPKRYDWVEEQREWVYMRDGTSLRGLLKEEIGIEYPELEEED